MSWLGIWRCDLPIVVALLGAAGAYGAGVARYRRLRDRPWPCVRTLWFGLALASATVAIESPLDAAAATHFAPHMVQHLVLTDVSAPLLLLGAPLLLALGTLPNRAARRVVALSRSRFGHGITSPLAAWAAFVLALWLSHDVRFFESALEHESVHVVEHALYLGTALLFWFPIVAIGPTPWSEAPLAYPLRMLYLFIAMPAEGMLGFTLSSARHVLYPAYARAGIADQQAAGEIMWIGGTLAMFVAFMLVGSEWARAEQRSGERFNARAEATAEAAERARSRDGRPSACP
ncbi:MAG: cytochrome c oxidase assembly protein [Vulcanimicrobiaceae bacterium]